MKAISILQPWASLVALGHKKIETRSWNTKYRGELLIHASKKQTHMLDTIGKRLCDGGEIEAEKLNLLLMFNQGTNVCFSTKAPLLQNRCYVPFFFGI